MRFRLLTPHLRFKKRNQIPSLPGHLNHPPLHRPYLPHPALVLIGRLKHLGNPLNQLTRVVLQQVVLLPGSHQASDPTRVPTPGLPRADRRGEDIDPRPLPVIMDIHQRAQPIQAAHLQAPDPLHPFRHLRSSHRSRTRMTICRVTRHPSRLRRSRCLLFQARIR